jgi:hypothetical protein
VEDHDSAERSGQQSDRKRPPLKDVLGVKNKKDLPDLATWTHDVIVNGKA